MNTLFEEGDFDVIQLLYGFVLIATALLVGVVFIGNTIILGAAVALLLLKDGMPNFIIGAQKVGKKGRAGVGERVGERK